MLRDHFSPPLKVERHWQGFHSAWATVIASELNRVLPERYFAEPHVQFGIEIDVSAFKKVSGGGTDMVREANAASAWSLPAPTQTLPIPTISDLVEVLVFNDVGGPTLVAGIELVSPANKDRPATRDAFVSKCASMTQQGIGMVIVDAVTESKANLHNELLARLMPPEWIPMESDLYAASYHVVEREGQTALETWQEPLSVGKPLPTMPLFLRGGPYVPVGLNESYERTLRELRIT